MAVFVLPACSHGNDCWYGLQNTFKVAEKTSLHAKPLVLIIILIILHLLLSVLWFVAYAHLTTAALPPDWPVSTARKTWVVQWGTRVKLFVRCEKLKEKTREVKETNRNIMIKNNWKRFNKYKPNYNRRKIAEKNAQTINLEWKWYPDIISNCQTR